MLKEVYLAGRGKGPQHHSVLIYVSITYQTSYAYSSTLTHIDEKNMYNEHLHCLSCTSQFKNLHLHEKKKKTYKNVAGALGVPIEFDKRLINSSSTNNITQVLPIN